MNYHGHRCATDNSWLEQMRLFTAEGSPTELYHHVTKNFTILPQKGLQDKTLCGIINLMGYTFSGTAFFVGILIIAAGAALVLWHRQIADNFGGGVGSYDRYKLWGVIGVVGGLFVMMNLHYVVLGGLLSLVFNR